LLQHYSSWRIYLSAGFVAFLIGGAVLTYFEGKQKEDLGTKIRQMELELEDAKNETRKKETAAKDALDRSSVLAEQLNRLQGIASMHKQQPKIRGEIRKVRLFQWQPASAARRSPNDLAATMGILVFARIENNGSSSTLTEWELSIEFPDHTIINPQKWPVRREMRIPCEEGVITISKDQYLDARKSEQEFQKTGERSGVTVWMVRDTPTNRIRTKDSIYTLKARDNRGVAHVLETFTLASSPQACVGFDFMN
jgi:hypothetical protein